MVDTFFPPFPSRPENWFRLFLFPPGNSDLNIPLFIPGRLSQSKINLRLENLILFLTFFVLHRINCRPHGKVPSKNRNRNLPRIYIQRRFSLGRIPPAALTVVSYGFPEGCASSAEFDYARTNVCQFTGVFVRSASATPSKTEKRKFGGEAKDFATAVVIVPVNGRRKTAVRVRPLLFSERTVSVSELPTCLSSVILSFYPIIRPRFQSFCPRNMFRD